MLFKSSLNVLKIKFKGEGLKISGILILNKFLGLLFSPNVTIKPGFLKCNLLDLYLTEKQTLVKIKFVLEKILSLKIKYPLFGFERRQLI